MDNQKTDDASSDRLLGTEGFKQMVHCHRRNLLASCVALGKLTDHEAAEYLFTQVRGRYYDAGKFSVSGVPIKWNQISWSDLRGNDTQREMIRAQSMRLEYFSAVCSCDLVIDPATKRYQFTLDHDGPPFPRTWTKSWFTAMLAVYYYVFSLRLASTQGLKRVTDEIKKIDNDRHGNPGRVGIAQAFAAEMRLRNMEATLGKSLIALVYTFKSLADSFPEIADYYRLADFTAEQEHAALFQYVVSALQADGLALPYVDIAQLHATFDRDTYHTVTEHLREWHNTPLSTRDELQTPTS